MRSRPDVYWDVRECTRDDDLRTGENRLVYTERETTVGIAVARASDQDTGAIRFCRAPGHIFPRCAKFFVSLAKTKKKKNTVSRTLQYDVFFRSTYLE